MLFYQYGHKLVSKKNEFLMNKLGEFIFCQNVFYCWNSVFKNIHSIHSIIVVVFATALDRSIQ